MKKNICIITGSRAEYGLLRTLIKEIDESKTLNYQLICTGSHLSKRSGKTINEILKDGFKIDAIVPILSKTSSSLDTCNATGDCIKKISKELFHLNPEIVILLGDRFEIFASAAAATILNIPIAHIHGGETTQGAIDEAFRHSITKMSLLHFAATDTYKQRIIQLGEKEDRVYNVGAMGIDAIKNTRLLSKKDINKKLGINTDLKYLMITYHPQTLSNKTPKYQVDSLLQALKDFDGLNFIFTGSNLDTGGDDINSKIISFVEKNKNCYFFESLGQQLYFSLLKYSSGVIGNSSSGILEVPFFKIGTVNIGDRQRGRVMCESILNVDHDAIQIKKAIDKIISESFSKKIMLKFQKSPYGNGGASKKIVKILEKKLVHKNYLNLNKEFKDIL